MGLILSVYKFAVIALQNTLSHAFLEIIAFLGLLESEALEAFLVCHSFRCAITPKKIPISTPRSPKVITLMCAYLKILRWRMKKRAIEVMMDPSSAVNHAEAQPTIRSRCYHPS